MQKQRPYADIGGINFPAAESISLSTCLTHTVCKWDNDCERQDKQILQAIRCSIRASWHSPGAKAGGVEILGGTEGGCVDVSGGDWIGAWLGGGVLLPSEPRPAASKLLSLFAGPLLTITVGFRY